MLDEESRKLVKGIATIEESRPTFNSSSKSLITKFMNESNLDHFKEI